MPTSVQYDLAEGVATITLNRPDAMNSLTVEIEDGAARGGGARA